MDKDEYFEGDYRRKPPQNLSGVKQNQKVSDFIDKVKRDRKKREADRVETEKATVIQATYRGLMCRKNIKFQMKKEVNSKLVEINQKLKQNIDLNLDDIKFLICHMRLIYPKKYFSNSSTIKEKDDYENVLYLSNVVSVYKSRIILAMLEDTDWLWRIIYLLYLYMDIIKSCPVNCPIPSILQTFKGLLDPDIYQNCDLYKERSNILIKIMEKLLSNGLFKILIMILENKSSMPQDIFYNTTLSHIHDLFKIVLCTVSTTKNVHFQQSSLKFLTEEIVCKEMPEETRNLISPFFKEMETFPLQALSEVILSLDENLYTIHTLHNFLRFFGNEEIMTSTEEQKMYFLLLSKLTINIPLLARSLHSFDERACTFSDNNCLIFIDSSERTEKWLTSLLCFIKRRDYDGLLWFCKCIYHLWLYDCAPIYKYRLIRKIAFQPSFLKELLNYINAEKRILSFSSQLYSATVLSMLSTGVAITSIEADRIIPPLTMFCYFFKNYISLLSDELLYQEELFPGGEQAATFTLNEIVTICSMFKEVAVGIISLAFPPISINGVEQRIDVFTPTGHLKFNTLAWRTLFEQVVSLLRLLHDRDCRQNFTVDSSFWLSSALQEMDESFSKLKNIEKLNPFSSAPESVYRDFTVHEIRYLTAIHILPFTVGFFKRFALYQSYIEEDKMEFQDPERHFLQVPYVVLRARRDYIYEDAFEKLSIEPEIRKHIRVHLISSLGVEEIGIDGGGLFREFMTEFLKTAFDPNRGFFILNRDNEFYPNPNISIICNDFQAHYNFIGKMLGKALFENILVEVPLADFFLAEIMGLCNESYINGLATLDPDLYKNLISLTCYKGDLSELGLDFTLTLNDFGESKVVELKPNGKNIPVNEENVLEFVHLVARFKAHTLIEDQTASFFEGLGSVVSLEWLHMFTARELQLIISGNKSPIDIDDMKEHTFYTGGYSAQHPTIEMFWKVVKSFSNAQRSLLLRFVTSCSRPPLLGFKELSPPLSIHLVECDDNRLPSSSTCMNMLKLPVFTSEDIMKERLLYAIQSRSGFELS